MNNSVGYIAHQNTLLNLTEYLSEVFFRHHINGLFLGGQEMADEALWEAVPLQVPLERRVVLVVQRTPVRLARHSAEGRTYTRHGL